MSTQQEEFKIIIDAETEEAGSNLEDMGGIFDGLGAIVTGFAATAGAALVSLAAIIVGKAVSSTEDLDRAVANLSNQTGASTKEMGEFRDNIKDIYTQNWGESFDDIAQAMAEVKKQTKLTGDELKNTTKDAIILRDTFGYEVNESTRAAKQLMDQFGISSREAFNFIAQGAQKGLDKNGDLLDTINEYANQFKALGFTSEQMFDTLVAGAEGGAFSIDKIGDAVKEFNIRAKDGSKTSSDAFTALGMDAEKMTKRFAAGGEDANKAFYEVIDTLGKIKDPVKQNAIGVGLFGTMFEDLEAKGVLALGKVEKGFDKTKDTMADLDANTFKGIGEYLTTFGRLLEVNVLIPLGEKITPVLHAFLKWFESNLPKIIDIMGRVADFFKKTFGPIIMQSFDDAKKQLGNFISGSGDLTTQIGPIMDALKDLFKSVADMWGQYSKVIINDVLPAVLNVLKVWGPLIGSVFVGVIKALTLMYQGWNAIFSFLAPVISGVASYISGAVSGILTIIRGLVTMVSGIIHGDWSEVWKGAKMIVSGIFNNIKLLIKTSWTVIAGIFKVGLTIMVGLIKFYLKAGVAVFVGSINLMKALINKGFSFMVNTIRTKGGNIREIIKNVFNYIKNTLSGLAKSAFNWGANFLSAFGKGVKSKLKELKDAALDAAKAIKKVLGFHSPTKEGPGRFADTWAPNFMDMFIDGLRSKQMELSKLAGGMAGILEHSSQVDVNPVRPGGGSTNATVTMNGAYLDQRMIEMVMQRTIRMIKNRR
jgi:hypothetical protein